MIQQGRKDMIKSKYLVTPGKKVKLSKIDTSDKGKFEDKGDAEQASEKTLEKLKDLQDVLYAEGKHALLVVLQAMDAGGKDGTIRHVFSGVNPQGCQVTSFKAPTELELAHDYLWRVHSAAPRKGMIGIFNRSHYESVLVERVKELVPKRVWQKRYEHINAFEKLLADEGTVILKFYLHISEEEQKRRLEDRLHDPTKNWKFNAKDLEERRHWDAYVEAYEDALEKCSTDYAPWYVVPADQKWLRNWVISDTIVRTLEELDLHYPAPAPGIENLEVE
jgi:PPK2 family polyphosphate:nucleotide phosphotransferase